MTSWWSPPQATPTDAPESFKGTPSSDAAVFPADYAGVLAVSAAAPGNDDLRQYVAPNRDTDVAAPTDGGLSYNVTGQKCVMTEVATSWAAAEVSGVVALLRAAFPHDNAKQVVGRLQRDRRGLRRGRQPVDRRGRRPGARRTHPGPVARSQRQGRAHRRGPRSEDVTARRRPSGSTCSAPRGRCCCGPDCWPARDGAGLHPAAAHPPLSRTSAPAVPRDARRPGAGRPIRAGRPTRSCGGSSTGQRRAGPERANGAAGCAPSAWRRIGDSNP